MSESHHAPCTRPWYLWPHLVPADWKGHGSVQVLPSIEHWLPVPEDLGLKVLDHVLHYFPETDRIQQNVKEAEEEALGLASV